MPPSNAVRPSGSPPMPAAGRPCEPWWPNLLSDAKNSCGRNLTSMNEAVKVAVTNDTMSILELMLQASLLVQIVMVLLILASLASWVVIFTKSSTLKNLRLESDNFDSEFWSGGELNGLYRRYTEEEAEPLGMASIFVAGYREYNRLAGNGTVDRTELVDGVHRAMRVALSREIETLESRLSFLATVGSTSPYVGLFGTVWGIMNSFRSLGALQQVTVATVAPGDRKSTRLNSSHW